MSSWLASLSVVDVRIHKLNGVERYTYDSQDNRIPVKSSTTSQGTTAGGKEHGGTPKKEHGGQ